MSDYITLFCTVPTKEVGEKIAERLVGDRLAACVNMTGALSSVYRWKGEICRDEERLLIIKTRKALFEILCRAVVSLHPYEVPEIISLPIEEGHRPYIDWIGENTLEK